MLKKTDKDQNRAASLDSATERLRHQLGVLKGHLQGKDVASSLAEVDHTTEELIGEVFGSSSDKGEAYAYARIGEASSIYICPMRLPKRWARIWSGKA